MKTMNCLEIRNLRVSFPTEDGLVRAVDGLDLSISQGESVCLVGESGCGKTVVGLSIMRLLPANACISGSILLNGEELLTLSEKEMRHWRGREIGMIFEQPASCLNPVFPVGDQIAEVVMAYEKCSRRDAMKRTIELMEQLAIPLAQKQVSKYPHEFSLGMQQRIMIAIALACRPRMLIADEPTSSLDIITQVQIMRLLEELAMEYQLTMLLITHDMAVAGELCHRLAVMYAGELMETGLSQELLRQPSHPYTQALLGAISGTELRPIPGSVPELTHLPPGCRFHPRCAQARSICKECHPEIKDGIRCHLWQRK